MLMYARQVRAKKRSIKNRNTEMKQRERKNETANQNIEYQNISSAITKHRRIFFSKALSLPVYSVNPSRQGQVVLWVFHWSFAYRCIQNLQVCIFEREVFVS